MMMGWGYWSCCALFCRSERSDRSDGPRGACPVQGYPNPLIGFRWTLPAAGRKTQRAIANGARRIAIERRRARGADMERQRFGFPKLVAVALDNISRHGVPQSLQVRQIHPVIGIFESFQRAGNRLQIIRGPACPFSCALRGQNLLGLRFLDPCEQRAGFWSVWSAAETCEELLERRLAVPVGPLPFQPFEQPLRLGNIGPARMFLQKFLHLPNRWIADYALPIGLLDSRRIGPRGLHRCSLRRRFWRSLRLGQGSQLRLRPAQLDRAAATEISGGLRACESLVGKLDLVLSRRNLDGERS